MNEDRVKEIMENWLNRRPDVSYVRREQIIISEGLTADLVAFNSQGEAVYIVECKGNVGLSELAKGIGQAYQYHYQKLMNAQMKSAKVLLAVPRNLDSHFSRLKIPEEIKIFFVEDDGSVYERTTKRRGRVAVELQLPGTFYIRDITLNHIKYLILTIHEEMKRKKGKLKLKDIMARTRRERPEIAAAGYNHFITLRALGLINSQNRLTPKGYHVLGLIEKSKREFQREMCNYFYCFLINVLNAIIVLASEKKFSLDDIQCTYREISEKICQIWGQTIRFMYDPRTISTAMRILQEVNAIVKIGRGRYKLNKLIHPNFLPW